MFDRVIGILLMIIGIILCAINNRIVMCIGGIVLIIYGTTLVSRSIRNLIDVLKSIRIGINQR